MASLRILSGTLEGQDIELPPDPQTIGRGSACNVRLGDQGVSSKHAKIWCEAGRFFLMDLGSTNGTFINDKDVDRAELNDGDEITFGMTKARFVGDKPKARPAAEPPRPAAPARNGGHATLMEMAPEGIVADPPRRSAAPALRAEVKTADEIEIATLRGKAAFFEEENRKLKAQMVKGQEQAAHDAAAWARADAEKLRNLLKQRDDELKKLRKELDEKETYYSPAELERERKRMETAIEAERRREVETLQRQIKELEHRAAVRGAESDTVARQLKEKDDLIRMLSEREDQIQKEIAAREDKVAKALVEAKTLKDQLNAQAGKEKELTDKLKQKNAQLAQLGKERGDLVQDLARSRLVIAKLGGAEEAAAAVAEEERAAKAMQDRIAQLEADVARAKDAASVMGGKLDAIETDKQDLRSQIEELETKLDAAQEARMKVDGQLSDLLRRSGDRDSFEKQLAMITADRDDRAKDARDAQDRAAEIERQLARIRGTYDDVVRERDDLKAKVESLGADLRMSQTHSELGSDWEARYKSALEELSDLRQELTRAKADLQQSQDAKGGGGAGEVDDSKLKLAHACADLHETLVLRMLDGVNNSVSLLRRNAELLRTYVQDCGLLANAIRRIDYTRLVPEQQQMLLELVDETQPDVVVKNMQGISEENAESIGKAKKLIVDYSDAFRKDETRGIELESAFARAQGLFHATGPETDVPVKIEAVLPPLEGAKDEAILWAFALLREGAQNAADGNAPAIRIDSDGLTVTATLSGLDPKVKERYRELGDPQARLVRGFAVDRCGGRFDIRDENGVASLSLTLKAKM
jgi:pSer/pThr/pTyr-binding forkhead associated (FHA) protein